MLQIEDNVTAYLTHVDVQRSSRQGGQHFGFMLAIPTVHEKKKVVNDNVVLFLRRLQSIKKFSSFELFLILYTVSNA